MLNQITMPPLMKILFDLWLQFPEEKALLGNDSLHVYYDPLGNHYLRYYRTKEFYMYYNGFEVSGDQKYILSEKDKYRVRKILRLL